MVRPVAPHKPAHAEVLKLLSEFSAFGATDAGGVSRLACSRQDGAARDHFVNWLKRNDFEVQIDPIGNIFGWINIGEKDGERAFLCGSHLDSQPDGGRFDGVLGVVTAMVVAKSLKDASALNRISSEFDKLAVVAWTNEEGARFQPSLLGSGAFSKSIPLDSAMAYQDADGVSVEEALRAIGYLGEDVPLLPDYYFELHIEQGKELETTGNNIGIVEACWGAIKFEVTIEGRADHTGPTPMSERKDALLAASHLIVAVRNLAQATASDLHTSVARIKVSPNSPNTIAENASLWVELRGSDQTELLAAAAEFKSYLSTLPQGTGCTAKITKNTMRNVVSFDATGTNLTEMAIRGAGLKTQRMRTVAGHDAVNLQAVCPSSLIFVPSKDGISHAPDEYTSDEDVLMGFDASLAAISSLLVTPVSHFNTGAQNA